MQLEVPGETPRYRLLLAHRSGMKKSQPRQAPVLNSCPRGGFR
jgi:hypothetical protein